MFTQEFLDNLAQRLALDCGITCDSYSEGGENFIDFHLITWAAPTKKVYTAILKGFKDLEIDKAEYSIYVSYDVSGFDYWMKQMQETQYGHLVVSLNEGFTMEQYDQLFEDFEKASNSLYDIQSECGEFVDYLLKTGDFKEAKKMLKESQKIDSCINYYNG